MNKIITLSSELIPKIAAGEVVERPASVIKELIENALDAQATNIVIETEEAGMRKIKISDDGIGMNPEDIKLAILPHTTSKIKNVEDLSLISTLGFRGEALSSICAVADVTIKSSEGKSPSGYEFRVSNSKPESFSVVPLAQGTVIEVSNLFSHVPARKKFLKSGANENQIILNVITAFALSNVGKGFEYYRDGKYIIRIKPADSLDVRAEKLLGKSLTDNFIPLFYQLGYLKIEGLISKPQAAKANRLDQFIFVNKRIVSDLSISKAVKDAYKNLLDSHSYPPFILSIFLDWGLLDVNVHPQKERVKFWNETEVLNAIYTAVTHGLNEANLTYQLNSTDSNDYNEKAVKHLYKKLKDHTPLWDVRDNIHSNSIDTAFQIANTYIAFPDNDKLVLIDQHAAHESILYEQLLESFENEKNPREIFTLEKPLIIPIPLSKFLFLKDNIDNLEKLGFDIDIFGNKEIKLNAILEIFKGHDIEKLLMELVDDLFEDSKVNIDKKSLQTIAFLSCRTAIKAGDKLNPEEIKRLLIKLEDSSDLYTCPHGRPLKIVVSSYELAKMFKRIK